MYKGAEYFNNDEGGVHFTASDMTRQRTTTNGLVKGRQGLLSKLCLAKR